MEGFTNRELKELLISALGITLVFAWPPSGAGWPSEFAIYFLFVGLGFAVHEAAHKFTAISRGAVSRFRMWTQGLLFAIVMRVLLGMAFIAPGATYWAKPFATEEDYGLVSAAGPASNIVMALVFMLGALAVPVMGVGAYINLQLAMFNLFPLPPLDGSKVIRWRPGLWAAMFFSTILLRGFIPVG